MNANRSNSQLEPAGRAPGYPAIEDGAVPPPLPAGAGDFRLSIVVPAYNEESHIGPTLSELLRFARNRFGTAEIIVVDDGSTDRTAPIVQEIAGGRDGNVPRVAVLSHTRNLGKGAAVRTGVLAASGDIVLFTDADLSAPIDEAALLIEPILRDECDIAIGSRALDRRLIGVRQSRFREMAGRVFNWLVRMCTRLTIRDTQCGFKAFRRSVMEPVFRAARVEGFAFDVEILYLARRRGLRIREIPVRWNHVEQTKVSLLRDSARMFRDVLAVRWNDLLGRYGRSFAAPATSHEDAFRAAEPTRPADRRFQSQTRGK